MTFGPVRQYGVSLFASAGVAGLIAGLAARPVLSNLFAGVQIAMTQPIRIEDAVIVENEWGVIEEITSAYVVVRLWDLRRMIVPLTYFIEKPFQNWTHESSALIGSVLFYLDYRAPIGIMREKLKEIVAASKNWDGKTAALQVTDTKQSAIEVRAIMSAASSGQAFELRCEVREKMIDFLQREHPEALPTARQIGFSARQRAAPRRRERAAVTAPRRIEGFAIVSEDGMLADATGVMPDSLKFEADQRFFENGLDAVDVVVHGRHSHEQQPHSHRRHRLIVTRAVAAVARRPGQRQSALVESGRRLVRAGACRARPAAAGRRHHRRHRGVRAVSAALRRVLFDARAGGAAAGRAGGISRGTGEDTRGHTRKPRARADRAHYPRPRKGPGGDGLAPALARQ